MKIFFLFHLLFVPLHQKPNNRGGIKYGNK